MRSLAPTPARIEYLGGVVADLLTESSLTPADLAKRELKEAAFNLLDAVGPRDRRVPRTGHGACRLFEEVAVALRSVISARDAVIDAVVDARLGQQKVLAAAVKVVLKHTVDNSAFGPLVVLHVKACFIALALCPNPNRHTSLERNCLPTILQAIGTDATADDAEL